MKCFFAQARHIPRAAITGPSPWRGANGWCGKQDTTPQSCKGTRFPKHAGNVGKARCCRARIPPGLESARRGVWRKQRPGCHV